jgi:D-glycero-D-manno-heptose 1,7-bisphosphate phosphatase
MITRISAVFIDRDGTLNEDVGYLNKPSDVTLIPGAAEAVARLNTKNIPVILVTNQSGLGRGWYRWSDFEAVMRQVTYLLEQQRAHIDGVYVCPHHPDGLGGYAHLNHPDRKPNPGMLLRAAREHGIDLHHSWMIGDKKIDLEAGRNAGCKVALVRTGYGRLVDGLFADLVAEDLGVAVDYILSITACSTERTNRLGLHLTD